MSDTPMTPPESAPTEDRRSVQFDLETTIVHRERARFRMIVESCRLATTRSVVLNDEAKSGAVTVCDLIAKEVDELGHE